MNDYGSLVVVAGRGPYAVISSTIDHAGAPRFQWDRGAGGLAQGGIPLPRGTRIICTPKSPEDLMAQAAGVQPPAFVERDVEQRFLLTSDQIRGDHGEYFGRVTWFLHHDRFVPGGSVDLDADRVTRLFYAHEAMNRAAARAVVENVNEMCDADPTLTPGEIPVLVQDHHFDLVPHLLATAWRDPANPRHAEPPPPAVLFIHTAIASTPSWRAFNAFVPHVAREHARALADSQVATHDETWANQLVSNLRLTLGRDAPVIVPWAGAYPPSAQRSQDIVGTPTFEADRRSLHAIAAGRSLVAAVARIDPPKNLPVLVEAFATMLDQHPELHGKVLLVVQTGAGRNFAEYRREFAALERAVKRVNADANSRGELPPVKLETDGSSFRATALQLDADVIAFVSTSDGFGHVALEGAYAGSNAALVVSPNTGAARWIEAHCPDAVVKVDPHSVQSIADGLHEALLLPPEVAQRRADALRVTAHQLVGRAPEWADEQVRWAMAPAVVNAIKFALTNFEPGVVAPDPGLGIG